jgi:hypothetical protein
MILIIDSLSIFELLIAELVTKIVQNGGPKYESHSKEEEITNVLSLKRKFVVFAQVPKLLTKLKVGITLGYAQLD